MATQYAVNDSEWDEVKIINGYAMFTGYVGIGARGLGVLIVTWTTVILLGGFVSDLEKMDIWCLTGITLIQTAGFIDFLLKLKLSDAVHSWWVLLVTLFTVVKDDKEERFQGKSKVIIYILAVIEGLVLYIMLCPLGVLYMLVLYISAGVSLWRIIDNDFGNAGGANKKVALLVLYTLAVAQAVLFVYKSIYGLVPGIWLVKFVVEHDTVDQDLVTEYLKETIVGCEKDPSFATGRNLVTYGVDLMMEAKSNEGLIAGIRVLGGTIKDYYPRGRKVLAKHLLTRLDSSTSHIIQRLLEIVGPRSPCSREVRENAARIVALVAHGIRLDQSPAVIECISSVLDDPNQQQDIQTDRIRLELFEVCNKLKNYERVELLDEYELDYLMHEHDQKRKSTERRRENTVHGFDGLLTETVNIIHQLALDEDNRRILSTTVLHRIARAPLKLHRDNHDVCSMSSQLQMLEKCWVLTEWFVAAVEEANSQGQILEDGQTAVPSGGEGEKGNGGNVQEDVEEEGERFLQSIVGTALGNAVINNIKSTIKSIFDCFNCRAMQKKQGIQILLHLGLDMSFIMDTESRTRRLTWILLLIFLSIDDSNYWMISRFTDRNKNMPDFSSIRRLAGEKLSDMLREKHELLSEENARELQLTRLARGDLSTAFSDDAEDISVRTHAAIIMEGLCVCYDPDYSGNAEEVLLGILVEVIPKVVNEILIRCASTKEETQAWASDVEGVSEHDVQASRMCEDGYTDNERLRKSLVSLCRDGYMGKYSRLKPQFEKIASKICKEQGKSLKYLKSLLV